MSSSSSTPVSANPRQSFDDSQDVFFASHSIEHAPVGLTLAAGCGVSHNIIMIYVCIIHTILISCDVNYYCYVIIVVGHVSELKRSLLIDLESACTCKKNELYMVPPLRPAFLSIWER